MDKAPAAIRTVNYRISARKGYPRPGPPLSNILRQSPKRSTGRERSSMRLNGSGCFRMVLSWRRGSSIVESLSRLHFQHSWPSSEANLRYGVNLLHCGDNQTVWASVRQRPVYFLGQKTTGTLRIPLSLTGLRVSVPSIPAGFFLANRVVPIFSTNIGLHLKGDNMHQTGISDRQIMDHQVVLGPTIGAMARSRQAEISDTLNGLEEGTVRPVSDPRSGVILVQAGPKSE